MIELAASLVAVVIWYALYFVEGLLVLVCLRAALGAPRMGDRWFRRVEHALACLARRRRLSVLTVGLLALVARAALMPVLPTRAPAVSDEFSYLLAADTFSSGRLTNPTHAMWTHFETMHVNQKPTYMSMYPPAQGLVLAAGQKLTGHPWAGVWFSSAVMCAAICWMLQGWLPPYWALLGGLIAVMRIGLFSYWVNSYWGGAVAATGGALLLGALPRIIKRQRAGDSLLLALGVAILANSRPYEGAFLCLPVAVALIWWMRGAKRPRALILFGKVIAPAGLTLALAAGAMGYYNRQVTGDPLRMPYQVNRDSYVTGKYFVWDSVNPSRSTAMRRCATST